MLSGDIHPGKRGKRHLEMLLEMYLSWKNLCQSKGVCVQTYEKSHENFTKVRNGKRVVTFFIFLVKIKLTNILSSGDGFFGLQNRRIVSTEKLNFPLCYKNIPVNYDEQYPNMGKKN